jgi:hypothetical protein
MKVNVYVHVSSSDYRKICNTIKMAIPESFLCIQPADSASKPKLSASSWWYRGSAQLVVQQMRVGWRAGFQCLKTGTFG